MKKKQLFIGGAVCTMVGLTGILTKTAILLLGRV